MIIVVGGIKGGTGKTTIATNLAVFGVKFGRKILLVDADEQGSASAWAEQREQTFLEKDYGDSASNHNPLDFPTVSLAGKNIYLQLKKFRNDYDDIVIDCGGRDTTTQRSILTIADKFVIPFKPRSFDIWTLGQLRNLIEGVQTINTQLQCFYLINQADFSGKDNADSIGLISEIPCLNAIPVMIGNRKAFGNAATDGLSVIEVEKRDKNACEEMFGCASFIYHGDIKEVPF
jgi:chromosome partitioning protein